MNEKSRPLQTMQSPQSTDTTSEKASPAEIQGHIGKQLRQVYGKLLAEPLPDKFAELLQQLSSNEKSS
jgi:hypothetical protein